MSSTDAPPGPEQLTTISATEAKNNFRSVLDRVMAHGKLAITKHDEVRAIVLSPREYEALLAKQYDPLSALADEFDDLVERMQSQRAESAGLALFDAGPEELGDAALAAQSEKQ